MIWRDRLKVLLRTMRYREAWGFGPRQSLGLLKFLGGSRPTWHAGRAEMNVYSPAVGGPAYARYLRGLRQMGRGVWTPLVVHVSVTDRCPYRCARCSNVARVDTEPSLAALVELAGQLHAAGTCRVALTGGEPLVRGDLPAIVAACGAELSPVVFTSGYGLDAGRARDLAQAGLAAVYVSLDHYRAQEHDGIRGPGAFEQAVAAIRACRAAGLFTAAQAVVGRSLAADGELDRFLAFCQGLGVQDTMLLEPVPVGSGAIAVDGEADEALRQRLADAHCRAARDDALPKVSSMSWLESPECLGCQAGFAFLYITAGGEVFPCDFVPLSFGNVYALGLPEIHARMVRFLGRPSGRCLARRLATMCGSDRTWPIPWDQTQAILTGYDPGPTPKFLRYLAP